MKSSAHRLRRVEPETPGTSSQSAEFARLTEETERLAKHVQELRLRIAASARRRNSSGSQPVPTEPVHDEPLAEAPPEEGPPRVPSANERESCLASVSRWLPPLAPPPPAVGSSVAEKKGEEGGRYSLISARRGRRAAPMESARLGRQKMPA